MKKIRSKKTLTAFQNYLSTDYRHDLERLIGPFNRVMFGDMTSAESWRNQMGAAQITETAYFSVAAWLECLLQAVVHFHDQSNYEEYIKLIGIRVTAPASGSGFSGSLFPDKFLVGHPNWTKLDCAWVEPGIEMLFISWCTQYKKIFGDLALIRVKRGIESDPDIRFESFEQPRFLVEILTRILKPRKAAA